MNTIGSFAAKTHFAELLDRVARGEVITITRRGHPVARLVPPTLTFDEARCRRNIEDLRHARAGQDRGARPGTRIPELIAKGRARMSTQRPRVVVDASIILALYLDDEQSLKSERLLDALWKLALHAPSLWAVEGANALLLAARKRISEHTVQWAGLPASLSAL